MSVCHVHASGTVELYFYGELSERDRTALERHAAGCFECRRALEELAAIRAALDARPGVSAPPGGDWSAFMARLDAATHGAPAPPGIGASAAGSPQRPRGLTTALAIAALLSLVTIGALVSIRTASSPAPDIASSTTTAVLPVRSSEAPAEAATARAAAGDAALTAVSEQHFTRSKLVVLGLATKNPADAAGVDWDYERTLATSLLSDTRLYRRAAEERGLRPLADVMGDLELLLLQTSMSQTPDAEALTQLQQLIRRRDLLTKMDAVTTAGL